ncbi:isochorismatase family protein [Ensifer adhaerens]|uniref:isochorismatase family protein n=1 Tax=Ensifer adhaerens TaxID=106592 RepID=UPI001CC17A54|nr:isochorismatase family protein [Ensifer adhaerens]MBZ7924423.1 isochorismatase family protein [Ensifer adhaerens]UAX96332.1 isochorismatase family protein [Ensifer adhaerens]UAY04325.1 isochorismatase family protein [Ensifer adhaerens]UAY12310.1 isochorismatase family protein [Ensifer adhaerens]
MTHHPTIRTIAGAPAPESLDPKTTALLAIDFQNEYFVGRMPIPDGEKALANAKRLIARADAERMKVYHVKHVTPAGSPVFAEDSETSSIHRDIQPAAGHSVVCKSSVSVFASTDLGVRLKQEGVETLVITGLMTHACVAGAARDAVPLGFNVIVASDACATRDLDTGDGDVVPHAVLHRSSLATIDDTFGDILTTDQVLALARRS